MHNENKTDRAAGRQYLIRNAFFVVDGQLHNISTRLAKGLVRAYCECNGLLQF